MDRGRERVDHQGPCDLTTTTTNFAYLLNIDAVAGAAEYETCSHGFGESTRLQICVNVKTICPTTRGLMYLIAYLFLILDRKCDELIVFRSN